MLNGDIYEGEFLNDKFHGEGTLKQIKKDIEIVGKTLTISETAIHSEIFHVHWKVQILDVSLIISWIWRN